MKIDLNKGVNIRIAGELGKFNTIPIDFLVKISRNLQELILNIAKNDIQNIGVIDPNNFKVELSGFNPGSAIPQFTFTERINLTDGNVESQRKIVNRKFEELIEIANEGNYGKLKDIYTDPLKRNAIVNSIYGFVNSFGSAPVSFVELDGLKVKAEVYRLKRFRFETKYSLITEIKEKAELKEENYAVGKIKLTTTGTITKKKIEEIYTKSNTTISYSPSVIVHNDISYILNFPLRCLLEKEEDYYLIQSELLDIVGTGETEEEAELSFAEEFSFIHMRYNELDPLKLSDRLLQIKRILNYLVKKVQK